MKSRFLTLLLWQLLVIFSVAAQAGTEIATAYANEITVDGVADTGAGPVSVFDISYEVQTLIGRGEISGDGRFAVVVKPMLIEGHSIVAVDSNGQRSVHFTVVPMRSGSTPALPR